MKKSERIMKGESGDNCGPPFRLDLETNDKCFLCLKECSNSDLNDNRKESLNNLFRFLKLWDKIKLFKEESKLDVMTLLCVNCICITEDFQEKYQALELAKLYLVESTRKIWRAMTEAEKDPKRILEQNQMTGHVVDIRAKTYDSCCRKIGSALPRVYLKRMEVPHIRTSSSLREKTSSTPHSDFDDDHSPIKTEPDSLNESEPTAMDEHYNCSSDSENDDEIKNINMDITEPSELSKVLPGQYKTTKMVMVQSQIEKCPYCIATFDRMYSFRLHLHLISYHPEHFFANLRNESVTPSQFQKILGELLFTPFMKKMERDTHGRIKCDLCKKQFRNDGFRQLLRLKHHLATVHKSELTSHLLQIQKDANLNSILGKCNPRGIFCQCGIYLSTSSKVLRHKKDFCTMSHVPKLKEDGLSSKKVKKITEYRCPYCKAKLSQKRFNSHLIAFHPEHFFPSGARLESVSHDQFQKIVVELLLPHFIRENSTCVLCGTKYEGKEKKDDVVNVKHHLTSIHMPELTQHLNQIQRDPQLVEKLGDCNPNAIRCHCGAYLRTLRNQLFHVNQHCPKSKNLEVASTSSKNKNMKRLQEKAAKCKSCGSIFADTCYLQRHQKISQRCRAIRNLQPRKVSCEHCGVKIHQESLRSHRIYCKGRFLQEKKKRNDLEPEANETILPD